MHKFGLCSKKNFFSNVQNVGCEAKRSVYVVAYHNDRNSAFMQIFDKIVHFFLRSRIKRAYRLVEQKHFLSGAQCPGKKNSLLLSTGKFTVTPARKMSNSHFFHIFHGEFFFFFFVKWTATATALTARKNYFPDAGRKISLNKSLLR